jgi:long-chain acyl-CoA synthetase
MVILGWLFYGKFISFFKIMNAGKEKIKETPESAAYRRKPWLRSYERGVPEFIEYEEVCVHEFLERSAKDFPDRDALIFLGYRVTFKELKDMADRFATCLWDFGIRKGDAVAILLPNTIHCVAAYYGILRLGAIAVMINPLCSDPELEHQLSDSDSTVLITLDLLCNRMIDLRPRTKIKQIIYASIIDYLPFPRKILFPLVARKKELVSDVRKAEDVYKWKECLATYPPDPPAAEVEFDDVAMYQYTGGTTGISKGIILTHSNLSTQVQAMEAWFSKFNRGGEVVLGALPFFHVFGLSTVMNLGIYLAWTDVLVPRPQPAKLLEAIRKFMVTFAPLIPTMYIGMLNHPDLKKTDMTCLKGCFSGSAPLPVEVIHDFEKITGATIVEGFGMTETAPVTHINPFAGGARKVGSIGIPVSDTECCIVDMEEGIKAVPVGERGELIIKGPQVMKGYRDMREETEHTLKDGWIYTGDIAMMDEDGYFYIIDRKKDMIISGGYNIYPREIEAAFYKNPKVQDVCAIGIPDRKRGESVKVFMVLKERQAATEEEMRDFCKNKLTKYKWPKEIEFRSYLPKTNAGKVLRKELKLEEWKKREELGID